MEDMRISVDNGKYTVIIRKDGGLEALRYNEKWRDCVGDNLIFHMAYEIDELRNEIRQLKGAF